MRALVLGALATLLILSVTWLLLDGVAQRRRRHTTQSELRLSGLLSSLRSGDLLLASGKLWMQCLSRSHITHVAMIYQDPHTLSWYAWDTTRSHQQGAALTPLAQFLHEWWSEGRDKELSGSLHGRNSVLWRCRLGAPPEPVKLQHAIAKFSGSPYSLHLWKAFSNTVLPLSLHLPVLDEREDLVSEKCDMFCTQLVAATLMECGVLLRNREASEFKPSDFWTGEGLHWAAGFAPRAQHERILFPAHASSLEDFAAMLKSATHNPNAAAAFFGRLAQLGRSLNLNSHK